MLTLKERNDCLEAIKRLKIKKLNKERNHGKKQNFNPLSAIIKNVSSSIFCGEKRNEKCIENRF